MRIRLRTLLIVLAVGPMVLAYSWPHPPVPIATARRGETAEVDLIQVNTTPHFSQVLFLSRYPDGELHVREWRLLKEHFQIKHAWNGECECSWIESGIQRRVLAPRFQESKTSNDSEIADRLKVPKPARIPLWEHVSK
jgi:hypothetical protein